MRAARWTYIHVLMHVHILTKVSDQKRVTGTHTWDKTRMYMSVHKCAGGGVDLGSQVDIYSCTDACTHPNQGVGAEKGSL